MQIYNLSKRNQYLVSISLISAWVKVTRELLDLTRATLLWNMFRWSITESNMLNCIEKQGDNFPGRTALKSRTSTVNEIFE